MENRNTLNPNAKPSFLSSWMTANIVGLPILFGPYAVGIVASLFMAILSDGGSTPSDWDMFQFMVLACSVAVMGAYLGHMQSFPLKTRIPQGGKWIVATSVGVAIGAPVSWLAYTWILDSPLFTRPNSPFFYIYLWSHYLIFEVLLGLSIGIAQWFVLKQQVSKAGLWIIVWPILFTGGMALTQIRVLYIQFLRWVQQLMQTMTTPSFELRLPVFVNSLFLFIVPLLIALVTMSLLSGVFLEWLLQFQGKQEDGQ